MTSNTYLRSLVRPSIHLLYDASDPSRLFLTISIQSLLRLFNTMSNSPTATSVSKELVGIVVAAAAVGGALTYTWLQRQINNNSNSGHITAPSLKGVRANRSSFIFESKLETNDGSIVFPHNHEEKMRRRIAARVAVDEENRVPRKSVTVRVPATSANMGPGYDCIGMAVDLWSEVTVTRSDAFLITAEGDGAEEMPKDSTNLMVLGLEAAFQAADKPVPTLHYHVVSRIPYARGLGSSSAAIVAGIIAGLVLAGHRLPCWGSEALLQLAASIEGHPDNVAPVIYGGIQIGIHNGTRWVTERVPIPHGMQLVMFIPDFIGKTSDARNVLQSSISREDASFNIGRVAFLIHALCTGNLDNLKWGVQDKLHQPQRGAKLYQYLLPMIEAAQNAGACCGYLSGAGPTVMALTSGASGDIFTQREKERTDSAVAQAMLNTANELGIHGRLLVTQPVHEGARVIRVDPPFSSDTIMYRDNI